MHEGQSFVQQRQKSPVQRELVQVVHLGEPGFQYLKLIRCDVEWVLQRREGGSFGKEGPQFFETQKGFDDESNGALLVFLVIGVVVGVGLDVVDPFDHFVVVVLDVLGYGRVL